MSLAAFCEWLQATAFSTALQATFWVVPTLQSLHILMIGVVFVSILAVALKVLGVIRADEPLARVWQRFAPFLWGGIAVMAATGVLLVVTEPARELMSISFRLKMVLLAVGIAAAVAFGRRVARGAGSVSAATIEAPPPAGMRIGAIATVLLWLAIIFLGRAIAYDEAVWGTLAAQEQEVGG
jgi:hypothetical protein|nr:MAG: hypothetical protein DIU62_14980 [Pseudomonadota bacterium]